MITAAEAGLTTEVYDALKSADESGVVEIIAYQWHPDFSVQHTADHSDDGHDFGVCQHDSTLYRIGYDTCERLESGSWVEVSGYTRPTNARNIPVTLISDTDLHVFTATTSGIVQNTYNGSSWSGWSTIISNANIIFASATSQYRVHCVVEDSTNHLWNLAVAKYVLGSWSLTTSDVHWQYQITSFDAVDVDGTTDSLTMTSQVPGLLSAEYKDNAVKKYIVPSGGVIGFTYKHSTWSDHIAVDLSDEYSQWRYRSNLRLSKFNSTVYAFAWCSDGTNYAQITGYRIYKTKDGLHWSRGEFFNSSTECEQGLVLSELNGYIYALHRSSIYRAKTTLQFGIVHQDMWMDVTDYAIPNTLNYRRNRDMASLSISLDNSEHWAETSFLNGDKVVALTVKAGYWLYDEDGTPDALPTLIQQGIFEVDEIKPSDALTDYKLDISARDRTSWMSSKSESEQFKSWDPQAIGGDEFLNFDGSAYGGMGYTGTLQGVFSASDGVLKVISNRTEAIAENSYIIPLWNGTWSTSFTLASEANEIAGIMFWMQDKEHGWIFYYTQNDDKLRLLQWEGRSSGEDITTHWTSDTIGWTGSLGPHWLMITTKYAKITGYISSDGKTWTEILDYLAPGQIPLTYDNDGNAVDTQGFIPTGSVGYYAKGYSNEDEPSELPPTFPTPTTQITPVATRILPIRPYTVNTLPTKLFVAAAETSQAAIATAITTGGTFIYTDISRWLEGTAIWGSSDPFDYRKMYLLTTTGLYRCTPYSFSGWSLVADNEAVFGNASYIGHMIEMSINRRGYIAIASGANALAISFDYGRTWTRVGVGGATSFGTSLSYNDCDVAVSSHNSASSGVVYASIRNGGNSDIYKSTNWGLNWTYAGTVVSASVCARLNIPYKRGDGTPNINNASQVLYAQGGVPHGGNTTVLYKSTTAGTSWATEYYSTSGGGWGPAGSVCGSPIQTFTYDADVIISATLQRGAGGSYAGLMVRDTGVEISNNGIISASSSAFQNTLLNSFSYTRRAALLWNRAGTSAYLGYTYDGGLTMHSANLPSFFTGTPKLIGYAEWSLVDYQ